MFFVVFGLNTDPRTIPPVLGWAVVLAVATTVTKLATGWWAAQRQGIGPLGRARTGAALIARGEFSIVIAGLAVSYAAVPNELAALATAYVLLMAVLGPIAARVVEPVTRWVRSKVPDRATGAVAGLVGAAPDVAKAALGALNAPKAAFALPRAAHPRAASAALYSSRFGTPAASATAAAASFSRSPAATRSCTASTSDSTGGAADRAPLPRAPP